MEPDTLTPRHRATRTGGERRPVGLRPPETAGAIVEQGSGAVRFAQSLLHLSRTGIEGQAAGLRARRTAPDDDVAWWQATMALNRALRRGGRGHQAAVAAHLASQAVLAAATRTGLTLGPDVTAVARSAGEVARVLVAGDLNTTGAGYLARGWEDLLNPPAGLPSPSSPAGGGGHRTPRAAPHQPRRGRRT